MDQPFESNEFLDALNDIRCLGGQRPAPGSSGEMDDAAAPRSGSAYPTQIESEMRDAAANMERDLADLRRQVVAERATPSADDSLTDEEVQEVQARLQRRHRVNLDSEATVTQLEDPNLTARMNGARFRMQQDDDLKGDAAAKLGRARQKMAELSLELSGLGRGFQAGVEEIFLQAITVAKIANEITPPGSNRETLKTLCVRIAAAVGIIGDLTDEEVQTVQARLKQYLLFAQPEAPAMVACVAEARAVGADIRRGVLAERAAGVAGGLVATEIKAVRDRLQRYLLDVQLGDPRAAARPALDETKTPTIFERACQKLTEPDPPRQKLTELSLELSNFGRNLQTGIEEVFLQASNAAKIASGTTPHSFPAVPVGEPENAEALQALSVRTTAVATECQGIHDALTACIIKFDNARRDLEIALDALAAKTQVQASHVQASHVEP